MKYLLPGIMLLASVIVAAPLQADTADEVKVVSLAVHPAAEPTPALRYRLLPEYIDQEPGNAAQLYYLAANASERVEGKYKEHVGDWLETPLESLPTEAVVEMLNWHEAALRYLELAGQRERCHWDIAARSEGYKTLLPPLSELRALAKVLAVRCRLEIAEGRFDQAVKTLQTGLAAADHIAQGPTLVQSLVGAAIGAFMFERLEELSQAEGSPNLYWALTALPAPFIDIRRDLGIESALAYLTFPWLRDVRTQAPKAEQWQEFIQTLGYLRGGESFKDDPAAQAWHKLLMIGPAIKLRAQAKGYLLSHGYSADQVADMPARQVLAIYSVDVYDQLRDESFKWFNVPYYQAHKGLEAAKEVIDRANADGEGGPLVWLLPSLARAYLMMTKLDRRIAALRCIAAICLYAAEHDGALPASLDAVTAVPIPINPVTGQAFGYRVEGDRAILEAGVLLGQKAEHATRYEITIQH